MSAGISTLSAASPAAVTSVTYTIPASASPAVTLVTTPRTFCSRLAGVTATAAVSRICCGVASARHLLGAEHDGDVRVGEVGDAGDAGRVAGRDDDRQEVGGEDLGLGAVEPGLGELVHVGGVGRGEDVGRGALDDLLDERRRGVEAERGAGVGVGGLEGLADLGERLGQRRRREHGDVALDAGGGGGGDHIGRRRRRVESAASAASSSSSPQATATSDRTAREPSSRRGSSSHGRHCSQDLRFTSKELTTTLPGDGRLRLCRARRRHRRSAPTTSPWPSTSAWRSSPTASATAGRWGRCWRRTASSGGSGRCRDR